MRPSPPFRPGPEPCGVAAALVVGSGSGRRKLFNSVFASSARSSGTRGTLVGSSGSRQCACVPGPYSAAARPKPINMALVVSPFLHAATDGTLGAVRPPHVLHARWWRARPFFYSFYFPFCLLNNCPRFNNRTDSFGRLILM